LERKLKKGNVTFLIANILAYFIKNKIPYYSSKHVEKTTNFSSRNMVVPGC